ncbi:MAG TPA: Uma2 family endonuclease [Tepidisphaeraceae bacterium]|nr:Uma2 family endonuclease [Tepidisphaeraceae bacterium]
MTLQTLVTAEQLLEMGDIGRCELIQGEIKMMAPAGADHGAIANRLAFYITSHVLPRKLGEVYATETGFLISRNPDTTRAADVAFVRKDRLPREVVKGYFPGAPDLAVEVLSPGDRSPEVLEKVHGWIAAGTISVWVVDPLRRSITVHRASDVQVVYNAADELRDEPALRGFTMKLGDLFNAD